MEGGFLGTQTQARVCSPPSAGSGPPVCSWAGLQPLTSLLSRLAERDAGHWDLLPPHFGCPCSAPGTAIKPSMAVQARPCAHSGCSRGFIHICPRPAALAGGQGLSNPHCSSSCTWGTWGFLADLRQLCCPIKARHFTGTCFLHCLITTAARCGGSRLGESTPHSCKLWVGLQTASVPLTRLVNPLAPHGPHYALPHQKAGAVGSHASGLDTHSAATRALRAQAAWESLTHMCTPPGQADHTWTSRPHLPRSLACLAAKLPESARPVTAPRLLTSFPLPGSQAPLRRSPGTSTSAGPTDLHMEGRW